MNYKIEIIDSQNEAEPLELEYAERDSITLEWLGSDEKNQLIVGSQLTYTMEVGDAEDGAFEQYFTSDEKRFKVKLIAIDTPEDIIWQGYLLPESYSEPYRGAIFYVQFDASDGLGLLKGKTLEDIYYENEHSVIDYYKAILRQTDLFTFLYFSPAVINTNETNWNKIYIDGTKFIDDGEKKDSYKILSELLNSMQCQLYQADNRWYIEGFNKRNIINPKYTIYNIYATAELETQLEKNIKQLTWLPTPEINLNPAVGKINVFQESEKISTGKTLINGEQQDFSVNNALFEPYWFTDKWKLKPEIKPQIRKPDNQLTIVYDNQFTDEEAVTNYTSLVRPYYVKKNQRINFDISVQQLLFETYQEELLTDKFFEEIQNRQIYEIVLNGQVIKTNRDTSLVDVEYMEYSQNGSASTEFEFEIPENGILDVRLYMPKSLIEYANGAFTIYSGTVFKSLSLELVSEKEKVKSEIINNEKSSVKSEIELDIADNPLLINQSFYLTKQNELQSSNFNRLWFKIINYHIYEGDLIAQIPIRCAELASRFINLPNKVMHTNGDGTVIGQFIAGADIYFNFEGGEAHYINLGNQTSFSDGHIMIDARNVIDSTIERETWQQWTDDIYTEQPQRYADVIAKMQQYLYKNEAYSIEASTDKPVKYNDVIQFNYKDEIRYFHVTSCQWQPDGNTSNIFAHEMKYNGRKATELNSFVDAGPDRYLPQTGEPNDDQIYYDTAIVTVPSGDIQSAIITNISADGNFFISSGPTDFNAFITNLDGDNYEFELTVTDSNGVTASDTFKIIREEEKNVDLQFLESESYYDSSTNGVTGEEYNKERLNVYQLFFTPNLQATEIANIKFDVILNGFNNFKEFFNDPQNPFHVINANTCRVTVEKNGREVFRWEKLARDLQNSEFRLEAINNIIQREKLITTGANEIIKFKLYVKNENGLQNVVDVTNSAKIIIKEVNFVRQNIVQNNAFLPLERESKTVQP